MPSAVRITGAVAVAVVTHALACAALGGNLNPPAGPVAPTPGPEPRIAINSTNTPGDALSIYKITEPGSYYLTGNMPGTIFQHGIMIAASGVTIDLMGYEVIGKSAGIDGIICSVQGLENIEIRNGSIRDWNSDGIDFATNAARNVRIENIRVSGCQGRGIAVHHFADIVGCVVMECGGDGIFASYTGTITRCTVGRGAGVGSGIVIDFGQFTISNCSVYLHEGYGIDAGDDAVVIGCSVTRSDLAGIRAGSASVISDCATSGGSIGIEVARNSTVTNCTTLGTTYDGITATERCIIRGNMTHAAGDGGDGAGILITGADNRIEDNNCIGSDRGIDVTGTGNFIARNTCSGNTSNWEIGAGNVAYVVNAAVAPAISGLSGGVSPGSTNPNANYSY